MNLRALFTTAAAVALAATSSAQAEWLNSTSRHFVIYSDTNERALRKQATELERFDAALRYYFSLPSTDDIAANKLTIYTVSDLDAVQKVLGRGGIGGAYLPRADGSIAFTPREGNGNFTGAMQPRIVLFHEYAHHFLFGGQSFAYPMWYSEGFAEFASTALERDGKVWLGAAANHRGWGLLTGRGLSIRQLLDPPAKMTGQQADALYGRGWLFVHFLNFNPARNKQFVRYLQLFNAGKPSVEAATEAFGDLRKLDADLDRYLDRNTLPALPIAPDKLGSPTIDIRPLTSGERALIAMRMESERGVGDKTAPALYARAKVAAAPHARDAVAQGWLSEMAYDADDLTGAEAAADAALLVDPKQGQALLYKARVLLARAGKDKAAEAKRWADARAWIIKANRADPSSAGALALYYESFGMEGATPSKAAVAGLYRANQIAPQDREVRFSAARHHLLDGDVPEAKRLLRVLASEPHAGANSPSHRLLAQLDAGKTGAAALEAATKEAEKDAKPGK